MSVANTCTIPLDVIKVRMQLQNATAMENGMRIGLVSFFHSFNHIHFFPIVDGFLSFLVSLSSPLLLCSSRFAPFPFLRFLNKHFSFFFSPFFSRTLEK